MTSLKAFSIFAGLAASASAQNNPISLNPQPEVPQDASQPVDHNFPSLAFEKSSFAEFSGTGTDPNLFSDALVNILQEKIGKPLWIRIGGTSADQDHFNASQKQPVARPDPPITNKGLWNYSIGPSFFEGFNNFNNSRYIWMVPMAHEEGRHLNADGLKQSRMAINVLGNKLALLELGNEPNLYHEQGMRPASYDVAAYVAEALQHEKDVEANISSVPDNIKYQALAYASNVDRSIWNTQKAFDNNINQNGKIGSVSWHYYQAVKGDGATLRKTLLNHTATTSKLGRFIPEIRWLHDRNAAIDFVLGEVGSVIAPELKWTVQATFGNALWNVDMMLYSMSINVTRMHMQSGQGFGYALWNTTTVRPTFYSQAMVSDFIGSDTTKQFRIKHLNVPGDDETVAAYGGYVAGKLERLVLLNMQPYTQTQSGDRPDRTFQFKVPDGVKKVQIQRLMGPGSSATGGVSWGGIKWVKAANGVTEQKVEGGTDTLSPNGTSGMANIPVRDSEAVLVQF